MGSPIVLTSQLRHNVPLPYPSWIPVLETWTYASADDPTYTFTIPGDFREKYFVGMKLRLVQTSTKYFIITKVGYAAGSTTVTVYGGTGYDLTSATIEEPHYSCLKAPKGFPLNPASWTASVLNTGGGYKNNPVQNTWYGGTNDFTSGADITLDVPIGCWHLSYKCTMQINEPNVNMNVQATLTTDPAGDGAEDFVLWGGGRSAVFTMNIGYAYAYVDLSSKTTYYALVKTPTASIDMIGLSAVAIKAVCAYL